MKTLVLTAVAILASQPAAFAGIPKAAVAGAAPPAAVAFVGTADVVKALQGLSPKFTDDEPLRS